MLRLAKPLAIALGVWGYASEAGSQNPAVSAPRVEETPVMTIRIQISLDGAVVAGTLNDSKAAQDFAAMLPLKLTLQDYNGTEKISDLPRRLSREGAPDGVEPSAGDIAFYAPWGNLALFYRGFRYSPGLVLLGRIDAGLETLSRAGSMTATIERIAD